MIGFQEAQERSATAKLAAIKKAMAERGTSLVTLTGHSLGKLLLCSKITASDLAIGPQVVQSL